MPTLVILDILTVVVLFVSKVVTQVVVWFGGCFCCCFSFVSFLFFFEDDHEVRQVPMRYTVSLYYIRVKSGLMISGDTPLNGTKVAYAIIAMLIILIKKLLSIWVFLHVLFKITRMGTWENALWVLVWLFSSVNPEVPSAVWASALLILMCLLSNVDEQMLGKLRL